MGKKSKSNHHSKKVTNFAIKGPATSLKKTRSSASKTKQQLPNIDIPISTKNPALLNGRHRRRGQVPSVSSAALKQTSKGAQSASNQIEDRNRVALHKRKKEKQEWNINFENLLERGFTATTEKRRCSNRKHTAITRQHSSSFQFQAATFTVDKTTNEILTDTTRSLSTFQLISSSQPYHMYNETNGTLSRNDSDVVADSMQSAKPTNGHLQTENRFQGLADDNEDVLHVDSKQPSFSFHPPSFSLSSGIPLPTDSLSLLKIQNVDDDIDPDL